MDGLRVLFGTDIGLSSLAVIGGVLFIGARFGVWFRARIREDEAARAASRPSP